VVVAVALGVLVGLLAPDFAVRLEPLGTAFVALIRMMISPVIFCTIVLGGVGLIVGIDRFMSEARALTNFAGNAVATVLIGTWTGVVDRDQLDAVLSGQRPFDERTMVDPGEEPEPLDESARTSVHAGA
jgi:aerobic C4-dicarboxylate transport protein